MKKLQYLFLLVVLLLSCSNKETNVPKPKAYPRIDRTDQLLLHGMKGFSFRYSSDAHLTEIPIAKEGQVWFNMEYSKFQAALYCTYTNIIGDELLNMLQDNERFVFKHSDKYTSVQEFAFSDYEKHNYGMVYYFDGNAIAPYQFYLTDSVSYFLRGSLYYNNEVQVDSILPVTRSLQRDITNLMESFQNKSIK